MARVRLNPMFVAIWGKMGNMALKRRGNTFYTSNLPDFSGRVLSAAQVQTNTRFRAAVHYAKQVLADPEAVKQYEQSAKENRKSVYSTAIADYMAAHKQTDAT